MHSGPGLVWLAMVLCFVARAGGEDVVDEAKRATGKIDVHRLTNGDTAIIGLYGEPLGTRMEIGGKYGDWERNGKVTGLMLEGNWGNPPVLQIRGVELKKEVEYKLEGYEAGGFAGQPTWVSGKEDRENPFGFRTYFVVTKILSPATSKPVAIEDVKITFAQERHAPNGVPEEAMGAGVERAGKEAKDPNVNVSFGVVKDPNEHEPLSKLAKGKIAALVVTWADPAQFKTQAETATFLRERMASPLGNSFTFHVWSHELGSPMLAADVEHVEGKPGKLMIWPSGAAHALYVYRDGEGKWWFGNWFDVKVIEDARGK